MAKRIRLTITGLVVAGLVLGGVTLLGWMVDEKHFDRPDEEFDRLAAQLASLPGVSIDGTERWVEAPTFSDPSSWIGLTVEEANLPALLAATCVAEYEDTVSWSLRVETDRSNVVSLHGATPPSDEPGASRCPAFGFEAQSLVDGVDRVVTGLDLQPSTREDRFSLVVLEEPSGGLATLLPLVAHADDLRDAAGFDATRSVEINASTLGLIIGTGEQDRYLALLSELVEEHGVTSYWADGGGTPIDGVEKVQIMAPDQEHAAIEHRLRASGLRIADFPVRFIRADE